MDTTRFDLLAVLFTALALLGLPRLFRGWRALVAPEPSAEGSALAVYVAVFLAVPAATLAHEMGHLVVARALGAADATLHYRIFWGFVDYGTRLPDHGDWWVSLAGNVVSWALAAVSLWIGTTHCGKRQTERADLSTATENPNPVAPAAAGTESPSPEQSLTVSPPPGEGQISKTGGGEIAGVQTAGLRAVGPRPGTTQTGGLHSGNHPMTSLGSDAACQDGGPHPSSVPVNAAPEAQRAPGRDLRLPPGLCEAARVFGMLEMIHTLVAYPLMSLGSIPGADWTVIYGQPFWTGTWVVAAAHAVSLLWLWRVLRAG